MLYNILAMKNQIRRIAEGLYKQAIKEDLSVEDLGKKIDIIMDALGLEDSENTEEEDNNISKNEPELVDRNVETTEKDVVVEDEDSEETVEDDNEVGESLKNNSGKYKLVFNTNAKYRDWFSKLDKDSYSFSSSDEIFDFLDSKDIMLSYQNREDILNDSFPVRSIYWTLTKKENM